MGAQWRAAAVVSPVKKLRPGVLSRAPAAPSFPPAAVHCPFVQSAVPVFSSLLPSIPLPPQLSALTRPALARTRLPLPFPFSSSLPLPPSTTLPSFYSYLPSYPLLLLIPVSSASAPFLLHCAPLILYHSVCVPPTVIATTPRFAVLLVFLNTPSIRKNPSRFRYLQAFHFPL